MCGCIRGNGDRKEHRKDKPGWEIRRDSLWKKCDKMDKKRRHFEKQLEKMQDDRMQLKKKGAELKKLPEWKELEKKLNAGTGWWSLESVAELIEAGKKLSNGSVTERISAVRSMQRAGEELLGVLNLSFETPLSDPDAAVRCSAILVILEKVSHFGETCEEIMPRLEQIAKSDEDIIIREVATEALARICGRVVVRLGTEMVIVQNRALERRMPSSQ